MDWRDGIYIVPLRGTAEVDRLHVQVGDRGIETGIPEQGKPRLFWSVRVMDAEGVMSRRSKPNEAG
jgi:hypothetical protein